MIDAYINAHYNYLCEPVSRFLSLTYFYALNQQGDVVKIFRSLPSRDSNGNLNTEVSGNVWLLIAAVAYATSGITMPSPTYTYGS